MKAQIILVRYSDEKKDIHRTMILQEKKTLFLSNYNILEYISCSLIFLSAQYGCKTIGSALSDELFPCNLNPDITWGEVKSRKEIYNNMPLNSC